MAEARRVDPVLEAIVGSVELELAQVFGPGLVFEASRDLELLEDLVAVARRIGRNIELVRALRGHQTLAPNDELIALRFAAEDWVIFQDEAGLVQFPFVLEVQGGPKAAHAAPNDDEVKNLTGVVRGQVIRGEFTISYAVGRFEDLPGIPVAGAIVADAAGPVPSGGGRGRCAQQRRPATDQNAVEEVASGHCVLGADAAACPMSQADALLRY